MKRLQRYLTIVLSLGCASYVHAAAIDAGADLRKGAVFAGKESVLGKEGRNAVLWVCAASDVREPKVICSDLGINELEGPKAELQMFIRNERVSHHYGLRHGIALSECVELRRSIRRLLSKSTSFCVLGQYASLEETTQGSTYEWVFHDFKTSHGSACDFCD